MRLEEAICVAADAHAGQRDKHGEPYILHAVRVMTRVPWFARKAAVLHDVLEDTNVTFDELRRRGLSDNELAALDLLTRRHDETYVAYIERMASTEGIAARTAREVKLADLADNLSRMTPNLASLRGRYEEALLRLDPMGQQPIGDWRRRQVYALGEAR